MHAIRSFIAYDVYYHLRRFMGDGGNPLQIQLDSSPLNRYEATLLWLTMCLSVA